MSSETARRAFDLVFRRWMRRHVRVHVAGAVGPLPHGTPLLLCANHESWWDGFVLREVQRMLRPEGSFHAVMLDAELSRRPFLRPLGALGVTPGSIASVRRLLHTLTALAHRRPDAVIAYFPQGRIRPGSPQPLDFRRGVGAAAEALSPCLVLPVGIRVVPGRTHRMDALVSVGEPVEVPRGRAPSPALLERAVVEELDALGAFLARHGEDAPDRWPGLHGRLPRAADGPWAVHTMERWISRN